MIVADSIELLTKLNALANILLAKGVMTSKELNDAIVRSRSVVDQKVQKMKEKELSTEDQIGQMFTHLFKGV